MDESKNRLEVYEIGYLLNPNIPEEKISEEAESIKKLITGKGASILTEGAPYKEHLSYTMRKKTVSGSYDKFDEAYFGWVKFEIGSNLVEEIKKGFEKNNSIIRLLLTNTVRENTYLGKRASVIAASISAKGEVEEAKVEEKPTKPEETAPASIEEMDKSIDEMVKEV